MHQIKYQQFFYRLDDIIAYIWYFSSLSFKLYFFVLFLFCIKHFLCVTLISWHNKTFEFYMYSSNKTV